MALCSGALAQSKPPGIAPVSPAPPLSRKLAVNEWVPSTGDLVAAERSIAKLAIVGRALDGRVRLYAGEVREGRRYLVGALITPSWADRGHFVRAERMQDRPETLEAGAYLVKLSEVPKATSNGCATISIAFDVVRGSVGRSLCLRPRPRG